MRYRTLLLASVTPLLVAAGSTATRDTPLARLGWMAGCWEMRQGSRVIEEQWMAPRGRLMIGMSRTAVADEVRGHEHMRIELEPDGLVFHAWPSGQAPTAFRVAEQTAGAVSFANPGHDFPQRILYRSAAGGDSLLARIEGEVDGRHRAVDFPYGRVACPGRTVPPPAAARPPNPRLRG